MGMGHRQEGLKADSQAHSLCLPSNCEHAAPPLALARAAELLRRVAEQEAGGEGERGRRREVEAALQEASAIFKRELADKGQQLEQLRQEIRWGPGNCMPTSGFSWCAATASHSQRAVRSSQVPAHLDGGRSSRRSAASALHAVSWACSREHPAAQPCPLHDPMRGGGLARLCAQSLLQRQPPPGSVPRCASLLHAQRGSFGSGCRQGGRG